jgi:cellulose synthase operon protein C
MSSSRIILLGINLLLASCASGTIAQLKDAKVDLKDEKVEGGLDKAIQSYQLYVDKLPESKMTPESILRLADLKIKKEFDFLEYGVDAGKIKSIKPGDNAKEEFNDFEQRTTAGGETKSDKAIKPTPGGTGAGPQSAGTREAIALYKKLLNDYPNYELNDQALYKLARINEELGNVEEAMNMMDRLVKGYPHSRYTDEVQFRRGEYNYARKKFLDARDAYMAIIDIGAKSSYYEFALYKLGWTYYKQEQYEGALHQFVALLDHKVAIGYDLEHPKDSFDDKRIEDTYRVMSLSFSYLGGADAVAGYFKKYGKRTFEPSVYKNLGDYYLEKLRYSDAASTFKAFAKNNQFHSKSPSFEIWGIDSYKKGGFPKLVIEANKEFVTNYGLKSAYWTHFDVAAFNEVTGQVKTRLKELINFYHAQYQDNRLAKNKDENFQEAVKWYREFLNSFPKEEGAVAMHYRLAELLLENKLYRQAAVEFEHIAYDYPVHEKSADAGYASIYALRKSLANAAPDEAAHIKSDIIRNSLKFAEAFPRQSEKVTLVMSSALDDIYAMKMYGLAAATARKVIARYSASGPGRRAAWLIFAHSSSELGIYKDAEEGYQAVLGLTPENDPSRADLIENLAASLYKQGEQANKLGDYKTAATYFLLVGTDAPTAKIRLVADFDGITALIQSKNLPAAADGLRLFRANYPGSPQILELSKKLALAYKAAGDLSLAANEYDRLSIETPDVVFQRASMELAADLYFQAKEMDKAYPIYRRYVSLFPKPLEYKLEMRDKIATHLKTGSDMNLYLTELKQIMDEDAGGGSERTDRTRYLGAKAGLALAELTIKQFVAIKLENPYAESLLKKQNAMKVAKERLEQLLDYETDIVTSAATYYLAEMYYDFNRSLMKSERPYGLKGKEKEQYDLSIEEQAYLFEEKTIQVHQKNLELMTRGIFNSWIEKSIEKLAKLVPARYAKYEESSGYIKVLDNVSYEALVNPKQAASASSSVTIPATAGLMPARELTSAQKKEIESDFAEVMLSLKVVQYEKAIKLLSKIIAQAPNNPVPYINIALINEKKQNLTLAEENLKLAIKVDPGNPVANNEYALLFRKTGRFKEARQIYEYILDKYPNFTMAQKNLGILCDIYLKDIECALKYYSIYSGFMPDDGPVKIWIADIRGR